VPEIVLMDYDATFAQDPDAEHAEHSVVASRCRLDHNFDICEHGRPLHMVASCDCGLLSGNYYIGTQCPQCKQPVRPGFVTDLRYRAWLSIPEELPPVLHPAAFHVLNGWLGTKSGLLTRLMSDEEEVTLPRELLGTLGHGMWYFYRNFDNIIAYIANNLKKMRSAKARANTAYVLEYIQKHRHIMFVRHLPILNSALHMIVKTGTMANADACGHLAIGARSDLALAIRTYHHTAAEFRDYKSSVILRKAYLTYLEYGKKVFEKKVAQKHGQIRTNIVGSRLHCSIRGVIVPRTGEHRCDELEIPWTAAVAAWHLETINKLRQQRKLTERQIHEKLQRASVQYDPDIHAVFRQLIAESPYQALPLLLGRNPTILHAGIQLFFVKDVKTDPNDCAIGFSAQVCPGPNADSRSGLVWCAPNRVAS
jgi:hypothetical protein